MQLAGKKIFLRKMEPEDLEFLYSIENNSDIPDFKGTVTLVAQNVKHILTHQIIFADCYLVETNEKPKIAAEFLWIEEKEIDSYALPKLVELLISKLPED